MRERKDVDIRESLPAYESHPPEWLPKTHRSGDLGYPGFHPPRPGQDEDVLSEAQIKNGFVLGQPVPAETFSALAVVTNSLNAGDTLEKFELLVNEVFARRADRVPPIPPSSFRIPPRVTLNDAKRQAWFTDLANPNVPLSKLGKNVPHGAKGHDLLDLLHSNNVAIPRAVWFLRVFGANETAGLRNKPSYNPTQYSIEWATVMTGYMKKQLVDIALPSAPRPGMNIKQTFKGVLADADTRERWISRFTYCLELLRTFYAEGLVDHRVFLTWLLQQMANCNLAQAGFVTRLADEYLDGMISSRALCRPFVEACLGKLSEIRSTGVQEMLSSTEASLVALLQRVCLTIPDAFVSPPMWTAHCQLIEQVLIGNSVDSPNDQHSHEKLAAIHQLLYNNFHDIRRRNESMLFCNLPPRTLTRLNSAVSDVQLLNSISYGTDMATLQFFSLDTERPSDFFQKLDLLLTWSVTPLQYGDHRPFVAVTLIRQWRDRIGDRASRRDFARPDEFLQDQLFDWLDMSEIAGDAVNTRAVALIFGKLVKHELFSYAAYLQRLIARGEPDLLVSAEPGSRHREFLRCIPLFNSNPSLVNQRRVSLYGARTRETPEDLKARVIRKEIRAILPELFSGGSQMTSTAANDPFASCPTLLSASRFEQVHVIKQWLMPILKQAITSWDLSQLDLLRPYCLAVELLTQIKCYHCLLELSLILLGHSSGLDILVAVLDTLRRFHLIWVCMDEMRRITSVLYATHLAWKTRGASRKLMVQILEFDTGLYLDPIHRDHITSDMASFSLALRPETSQTEPTPAVITDILLLAGDPTAEAPSILANSLWFKFRASPDWAWKVWDNTVASLRQIPTMTTDTDRRQACALRYGTFLLHVDQHLPDGLDSQVLQWFHGQGKNEVAALSADAWDVLIIMLLYLSIHDALKTTTILQGLIYPAWQLAANASSSQHIQALNNFLNATIVLFDCLMVREGLGEDMTPPFDLLEVQCIRTRRQDVYREPNFRSLVANIPVLVFLENNELIQESLRAQVKSLRRTLCVDLQFQQGVYRNLTTVQEAFEYSSKEELGQDLGEQMVAALRMVLCEDPDSHDTSLWPDISSLLSPWKLAATTIELKFILRQLGRTMYQEPTRQSATASLDQLTDMIFHQSMTSEEAYFVAEMANGVDAEIAGKFINNGMKCLTEILQEMPSDDSLYERVQRAGELLRVLSYVAEPFRGDGTQLPRICASVQEQSFHTLSECFAALEGHLELNDSESTVQVKSFDGTKCTILLERILQFLLGFQKSWSSEMKNKASSLSSSLLRLALFYGNGDNYDMVAFSVTMDTQYYLLDDLPLDIKSPTFDPFRDYPDISLLDIPIDLPREFQKQIRALLTYFPPNAVVADLAVAHRDTSGALIHDGPVLNRPWEWIENLGDPPVLDPKEEEKERGERERLGTNYRVKNSASLSLDHFATRMTGDGILQCADSRAEGNLRTFEDGVSADSMFKRDWRETRVGVEVDPFVAGGRPKTELEHGNMGTSTPMQMRGERRPTPRASPASSVFSRSSAHHSGSAMSHRQSPGLGTLNRGSSSTVSEVLEETGGTRPVSKRKPETSSEDEIEIIEGPTLNRAAPPKKSRTKAAVKPKAKKR